MLSATHVPVVILGAGLTGLSAARELERRNVPYRLFEREARAGGHAVTVEDSGYRFDRTGHLLHVRSDALRADVIEWLEGDCLALERKSVVFSHGVYTRYPFQANTFGLPPAVAYECLLGFVQAHFADTKRAPENFEQFCLTHFGAGISRHFMLPYNSRLWGVPPSEITTAWCERFVPLPRLEDVLAGAVGANGAELGYNTRFLYPRRGIGELARALERQVHALQVNTEPRRIRARAREIVFDGEIVRYDALVSSAPLPALLGLFEELPAAVSAARARLRATHLYYLDVALAREALTDFQWAYVPEPKYPFYRVGCYTRFSEALAPAGKSSLYVELADRNPGALDAILPDVVRGLCEMRVIASPTDVAFARLRRLDTAYVIYDQHRDDALAAIEPFLEAERVISTGRYGGWNYSSMEDALEFGRAAAERAIGLL